MIVLTGPLRGRAELTLVDGRLGLAWQPWPLLEEQQCPEEPPAGVHIPLYGRKGLVVAHALVDQQDAIDLQRWRWCINHGGYAVRSEQGRAVLMHRQLLGASPGAEVDHINRNRLDNRRCNLRVTDQAGNARNCSRNRRSKQPYKGVRKTCRSWAAVLKCSGQWYYTGGFNTPEEAAVAYDLMAIALFGEFAATNFRYREHLDCEDTLRQAVARASEVLRLD
jgi:hypothetical protein